MRIFNKDFIINLQKTILWQYDNAEKLTSLINQKQAWYKINVTDFIANFFVNIFNLKTANDFGLNIWGKILNFPRQVINKNDSSIIDLTTEQYRFLLIGQILKFNMSCTLPEINSYLRLIFNQENNDNIYVVDNHNMTITYYITPEYISNEIKNLVLNYDFLPAPAGVLAIVNMGSYVTLTFTKNSSAYYYVVDVNGEVYTITDAEKSIDVLYNSDVTWRTEGTGVLQQTGNFAATENTTIATLYNVLTINTTPETATAYLLISGQTYQQKMIVVPTNTSIEYGIRAEGYVYEEDTVVMTQDRTITINMQELTQTVLAGTNDYISSPVYSLQTFTIKKAGRFQVLLEGEAGYFKYQTPNGNVLTYHGKGGRVYSQMMLTVGQTVEFKRIRGGRLQEQGYGVDLACGGAGIACYIDGILQLVAGGGGAVAERPYSGITQIYGLGGGGNIGGRGNYRGYSIDGTYGDNTTSDTNTAGGASYTKSNPNDSGTGYGGTAYVKDGLTATSSFGVVERVQAYGELSYINNI